MARKSHSIGLMHKNGKRSTTHIGWRHWSVEGADGETTKGRLILWLAWFAGLRYLRCVLTQRLVQVQVTATGVGSARMAVYLGPDRCIVGGLSLDDGRRSTRRFRTLRV